MRLETFLTPHIPDSEDTFSGSITIMIDVLRASTTICSALTNGAKEVIPVESLDKAVRIYSSLSREARFLGGERNGSKPAGFDAGNSPLDYSAEAVKNKTVIFTTTNGTRIFQKAKMATHRIIGGFVNQSLIVEFINEAIAMSNTENSIKIENIFIICAGNNGNLSFEDTMCAGAIINELSSKYPSVFLTDSSYAAQSLYLLQKSNIEEFLNLREHAQKLSTLGFDEDIKAALTVDLFPVVPVITGNSIKKHS